MLALSFIFAMIVILCTRYCPGTGDLNAYINDNDNSKKYESCVDSKVLESYCLLAGFFFCDCLGLQFATSSSGLNIVNLN